MLKKSKNIKICIVGLGYVGLPLAVEFSKKYTTIGLDKDNNRINELKNGYDKTLEIKSSELKSLNNIRFTSNYHDTKNCNIYIITVPTPVDKKNKPNLLPLKEASEIVGQLINKDDIVIYESTVYPGATEEYCVPIIEKCSNLKYNHDFFCGYSPERINPGDKKHSLKTIIKVTSGSNEITADFINALYSSIITAGTYKAKSIAVAEAAKVIENTQRDVNIALINELSIIFTKLGLNTSDILETAGTKWNFLPFSPGLVGGHCIGVDPYYLTYKAREIGYNPEIILAGRKINNKMGEIISENIRNKLIENGVNIIGARIAIMGFAFKENCPDIRNTKVINIFDNLKQQGANVFLTDPWSNKDQVKKEYNITLNNVNDLNNLDVIILSVSHNEYKDLGIDYWKSIMKNKAIFFDVKSIYRKRFFKNTKISYMSL
jgi:UDP-N-acetyl-D-glucosamine/UDP-N-acetyl-D-galactosamine dehydrogenase